MPYLVPYHGFGLSVRSLLKIYTEDTVKFCCKTQPDEKQVWQSIALLDTDIEPKEALLDAAQFGIRYVLLVVCMPPSTLNSQPATIVNNTVWHTFLQAFLNQPNSPYLDASSVLLLGEVSSADLLAQVSQLIMDAGLVPIVVSDSHHHSFALLNALSQSKNSAVNAINFAPYAHFSPLTSKVSYRNYYHAYQAGYLKHYHVIGLNEHLNNATAYTAMQQAKASFSSYQAIHTRRETTLSQAIEEAIQCEENAAIGLEIDTISLAHSSLASSLYPAFSSDDAAYYLHQLNKKARIGYVHLTTELAHCEPTDQAATQKACAHIITQAINSLLYTR